MGNTLSSKISYAVHENTSQNSDVTSTVDFVDSASHLPSTSVDPPQSCQPGTFDELHKPVKDLQFAPTDGLSLTAVKGLSSHFQVAHSLNLLNKASAYSFGATYVGNTKYSPTEMYPVMQGTMNNSGDLQAQIVHAFGKNVTVKANAQTKGSKIRSVQTGAEIKYKNSSISLIAIEPNIFDKTGVFVAQYMQGLTPNISVGASLIHTRSLAVQKNIYEFAARYKTPKWQLATSVGTMGLQSSFYRKANENVKVGVEFETAWQNFESQTSLCYQFDVPKMNMHFKGMVKSDWTVGASLDKRLFPFPLSLNMNATHNIKQDKTTVGLGATLG